MCAVMAEPRVKLGSFTGKKLESKKGTKSKLSNGRRTERMIRDTRKKGKHGSKHAG